MCSGVNRRHVILQFADPKLLLTRIATSITPEQYLLASKVRDMDLASSTPQGASWLLKALHPAEPSIAGVSVPDGCPVDTVQMEFTGTYSISSALLTTPPTSNWEGTVCLLPNPICPVNIDVKETAVPGNTGYTDLPVPALAGAILYDESWTYLTALCDEWRLAAESVTVHLDANALTDTGTVVSTQVPLKPTLLFVTSLPGHAHAPVCLFPKRPTYDNIMAMPRAYQANIRTGLYLPLKLSQTSQHWFSQRELVGINANATYTGNPQWDWTIPNSTTPAWPYETLTPTHTMVSGLVEGGLVPSMMADNMGIICFKNINPTSNIVLKWRICLEAKVRPSSAYVSHLRPAAPVDALALASYFRIIRELPDAYPASYNDSGKILDVISKVISTIGPALSVIPGYGPLIAAAATPLAGLAKMGSNYMKNPGKGKALKPLKRKQKKKSKQLPPEQPIVSANLKGSARNRAK